MNIKNYRVEDVGIGLGLCTDKDFIPVSYAKDCGTTAIDREAGALLSFTIASYIYRLKLNSDCCDANVI